MENQPFDNQSFVMENIKPLAMSAKKRDVLQENIEKTKEEIPLKTEVQSKNITEIK